ncbi:MAG TPA: protein kinase [Polyangiaceae bacterium]
MAKQSPGSRSLGAVVDGRYSLEKIIGSGAMGVVYLARDLNLDRKIALKLIARELSQDPMTIARFRREAQSLATIRHQHVVQVYAYGPHDGTYFFAMEFIDGETLDHLLAAKGHALPPEQVTSILRSVASGLGAVHQKGLVHRDVKPGNIVIEFDTGRPVLVDFGLAANVRPTDGATSFVGGTPYYMAPEQIQAGEDGATPPGPAADQYAFACMTFELLTGRPPYESQNVSAILAGHLHRQPPRLSDLRPELSPIDSTLMKAMSKRPGERFESCEAFIEALQPSFGTETSPLLLPMATPAQMATPISTSSVSSRDGAASLEPASDGPTDAHPTLDPSALAAAIPRRKSPSTIAIAAGIAVLFLGIGWLALHSKNAPPESSPVSATALTSATPQHDLPPVPEADPTVVPVDVSALPSSNRLTKGPTKPPLKSGPTVAPPNVNAGGGGNSLPTQTKPRTEYDQFGERK